MIWQVIILAIISLLCFEIIQRRRHFRLREEIGLTGPPTSFLFGNFLHMFDVIKNKGIEATPLIYPELEKTYGSTFGFYYGSNLEIVTTDPIIIKEIFISQFSNFVAKKKIAINMVYPILDGLIQVDHVGSYGVGWKEIRATISCIFTSGKMKKMHLFFQEHLDNLVDVLREKCTMDEGKIDVYAEFQALTMDIISKCALGQDISCVKVEDHNYLQLHPCFRIVTTNYTIELANSSPMSSTQSPEYFDYRAIFFPIFKYLRRFSIFGKEEHILLQGLSDNINERRKERTEGKSRPLPDLIDLMLAENEKRVENGEIPLHHDVIVSNAWAFFIAGFETTSTSLAFTTFLLAKHPEVQSRLYEEISSTFEDDERVDYERLMKMPYLHAVFSESLRVYPPVITFTGRRCIKETIIGGNIRVPEGVSVVTPVHAVMWNEKHYERPREFIPDRFLGENGKAVWSPTYLPFGIGPRNCAGARFAEMEFKSVLVEVTRRFVIQLDPDHEELKTVTAHVFQGPKGGQLYVRLLKRSAD